MTALWRDPCRLLTGRTLGPVDLRSCLEHAESGREDKEVLPEGAGKKGIQEGV